MFKWQSNVKKFFILFYINVNYRMVPELFFGELLTPVCQ